MDQAYPSNLTDKQWKLIKSILPKARHGGRPRSTNLRLVVNAVFYLNRTGCPWRYLPGAFPPWRTVYEYYMTWLENGVWLKITERLRNRVRKREGKNIYPSTLIIDSQSIRAHYGEERAYDGFKRLRGRKRQVLVDTLGLVHARKVQKASAHDGKWRLYFYRDWFHTILLSERKKKLSKTSIKYSIWSLPNEFFKNLWS